MTHNRVELRSSRLARRSDTQNRAGRVADDGIQMRPHPAKGALHLAAAGHDEVGADAYGLLADRVGHRSFENRMRCVDASPFLQLNKAGIGSLHEIVTVGS